MADGHVQLIPLSWRQIDQDVLSWSSGPYANGASYNSLHGLYRNESTQMQHSYKYRWQLWDYTYQATTDLPPGTPGFSLP